MGIDNNAMRAAVEKQKQLIRAKVTISFQSIAKAAFSYVSANVENVPGGEYGSPVLTGRFYSSITVGIGTIDRTVQPVNPEGSKHPYAGVKQSEYAQKINNATLDSIIYIANSLPYANRLEHYGWSKKTPNGIFKVAAAVVKQRFADGGINVTSSGGFSLIGGGN